MLKTGNDHYAPTREYITGTVRAFHEEARTVRSHAGTGRRDGFKIRWEQSRVGSSPTVSTSSAVPEEATTGSTAQTYADAANAQESWARGFESLRHCARIQGRARACRTRTQCAHPGHQIT